MSADAPTRSDAGDHPDAADEGDEVGDLDAGAPGFQVEHDDTHVWIHLDTEAEVGPSTDAGPSTGSARRAVLAAELDEPETVFVYAVARPGGHDRLAVLAVTRTQGAQVPSYELRYVVFDEAGRPGALYAFPWRLQVDERHPGTLDRVPTPVWEPSGDALAWIEWSDDEHVRLRTVGWFDDGVSSNPSDEATTYRLTDTPPGVQLDGWGHDGSQAVLTGTLDGETWRFLIEPGAGSAVVPQVPAIALASLSGPDGTAQSAEGVVP